MFHVSSNLPLNDYRLFGTQVVPTPPVLKILPKIFGHSDKTVRAEGSNLTLVLYQYLGPGIESWLGDLKPVQVKELKDSFEHLEKEGKGHKSLKPERLTRAAAREAATAVESPADDTEEPGGYFNPLSTDGKLYLSAYARYGSRSTSVRRSRGYWPQFIALPASRSQIFKVERTEGGSRQSFYVIDEYSSYQRFR